MAFSLKRFFLGKPLHSEHAKRERLPIILALPIFASDALSSVAYASEEIMAVLLLANVRYNYFYLTPWLSLAIVVLLAIVVMSYRQIVMAYPSGGGAYVVARDNLGEVAAQTAGASLLVDYVLTVAVSISAGVAAIVSLMLNFGYNIGYPTTIWICLFCVALLTLANLRGVRESGFAFAIPSYVFIVTMFALILTGLYKELFGGGLPAMHSPAEMLLEAPRRVPAIDGDANGMVALLTPFLLLRAFASGCTAMTGTEAISNGVTAFQEPASKNAATTMTIMATILAVLFLGISYLAWQVNALPAAGLHGLGEETVLSQVGRSIFQIGPLYWILQIFTCVILILAANTSFAGFPRLCAIQAQDGFLPRQLANTGDRLVFNNGILVLAALSALLIVIFRGEVHYLIPLYAVGVFMSFTISQSGMVKRWLRLKTEGWRTKITINGFGAVCTGIVMCVFAVVKFTQGAWVVVLLIPALILLFFRIKSHYRSVAGQLSLEGYRPRQGLRHFVLVLAPDIHRGVIPALQYARSISVDARAIHVSIDPSREQRLRERWTRHSRGVPLTMLPSPYRSLVDPVIEYIDRLQQQEPNSLVTLVIPEFMPTGWWPKLLHGQAGLMLSLRLRFKRGVVVISVPYHIEAYVSLEEDYARSRTLPDTAESAWAGNSGRAGGHSATARAARTAKDDSA